MNSFFFITMQINLHKDCRCKLDVNILIFILCFVSYIVNFSLSYSVIKEQFNSVQGYFIN